MKKVLPLLSTLLVICACEPYGEKTQQIYDINKDNYNRYYWFATYKEEDGIYVEINRRSMYAHGKDEVLKFNISYDYVSDEEVTRKTRLLSFEVGTNNDFVFLTGPKNNEDPQNIVHGSYGIEPFEVSGKCVIDYHYFKKVDLSTISQFPDYSCFSTSYTDLNGKVPIYGSKYAKINYDKISQHLFVLESVTIAFYQSIYEDDPEVPVVETYTKIGVDGFIYEPVFPAVRMKITGMKGYLYIF